MSRAFEHRTPCLWVTPCELGAGTPGGSRPESQGGLARWPVAVEGTGVSSLSVSFGV